VLQQQLKGLHLKRLIKECAKLDPEAEMALAEEGLDADMKNWPKY
jgi:hypothetical protein